MLSIYFLTISFITGLVIDYFLQYRLLKWIYFGTLTVIAVTLYNHGDDKDAATEIFKLARI